MDITLVLWSHSAFAALCGALAVLVPSFFGRVFPTLASSETLRFIVRIYSVLLLAQAPLLHGIRSVTTRCLRHFCAVYAFIFVGTAIVTAHSDLVLEVVGEDGRATLAVWIALVVVYGGFALSPAQGLFRVWAVVHMVMVCCLGGLGIAFPEQSNVRFFLVPNESAYNTVSRYYGVLILGMSMIAATATGDGARPALRSIRAAFSAMFAASGACLGLYLWGRGQFEPVGGCSLLTFAGMSALYGTARLPPVPKAS